MTVIAEISTERQRQISKEGWTPEHDDSHADSSLAMAAALYAAPTDLHQVFHSANGVHWRDPWPWKRDANHGRYEGVVEVNDHDKRKVHDRRRRLIIAAALIVAEIERLDRAAIEVLTKDDDWQPDDLARNSLDWLRRYHCDDDLTEQEHAGLGAHIDALALALTVKHETHQGDA